MKKSDLTTKKAVVIPAHVAVEILAHDITNVYVTYNVKSERFKFKTTLRNEKSDRVFITSEQLKKLLPSVITEKKEVSRKTEKTKAVTVTETRVSNDILESCITPVDCFNAILKVLKKTDLESVNTNTTNQTNSRNKLAIAIYQKEFRIKTNREHQISSNTLKLIDITASSKEDCFQSPPLSAITHLSLKTYVILMGLFNCPKRLLDSE